MANVNSFLFRMGQGVQGTDTRPAVSTIEAQALNSSLPFASYGIPGKIVSGLFVPVSAAGDTIYGFLVRPYPFTGANASDPLGTSTPPTSGIANIMRRGYLSVVCNAGTPAAGGVVYVRYANAAAGTPIGGIEATSVGGSNVAITASNGAPVTFTGGADANGNVEIQYNI